MKNILKTKFSGEEFIILLSNKTEFSFCSEYDDSECSEKVILEKDLPQLNKNSEIIITPDLETIKTYSYQRVKNITNLKLKKPNYGEIVFKDSVDITRSKIAEDFIFLREAINISKYN